MSEEGIIQMPQGVGQMVSQGMTLMKAENETMSSIAVLRPRSESEILKGALDELDLAPEQAKAAYYSIPFKDRKTNRTVYVQGLSIHGATTLALRWGNCSVSARIVNEDETGVDVEGVFLDFQTNFRISKPHRASKYRKVGDRWVLADEQRLLMAIQASVSKAQRNAIEAGLPSYLTEAYFEKARVVAGGAPNVKADPKRVEAVVAAFQRFKVTLAMLEESVGRSSTDWYGEDVSNLRGLYKALLDGGTSVAEIWPDHGPRPEGTISVPSLEAAAVKAGNASEHGKPDPETVKPAKAVTVQAEVVPEEDGADEYAEMARRLFE